jgi:hypothetical protein
MPKTDVTIYKVHCTVRKVHTRNQRMRASGPQRFVQRLLGGAIVVRRARSATITERQLLDNLGELKQAYEEGRIEIRTVTGSLVDLDTLKAAPLPPVVPQPHPPLDSVARDKQNVGEKKRVYIEGKAADETAIPPPKPALPGDEAFAKPVALGGDPALLRKKQRKEQLNEPPKE